MLFFPIVIQCSIAEEGLGPLPWWKAPEGGTEADENVEDIDADADADAEEEFMEQG